MFNRKNTKHENREGSAVTINSTWIRPEVRQAFGAASREVFHRSFDDAPHLRHVDGVFAQFAQRYETLCALPRRARRALERSWKKPLAAIALLLTLGQGTALAATINVDVNTPPEIKANGKCSLAEAIINANNDVTTHGDCPAGHLADAIVLPAKSNQQTTGYYGSNSSELPPVASVITIEGRGSTISPTGHVALMLHVASNGELTLNDTTVSGMTPNFPDSDANKGILNQGAITLNRSSILHCRYGGGLTNLGGVATLNDSIISNNWYDDSGAGGIENRGGSVTLVNSTISDNSGGGILNDEDSTLLLLNSTVDDNGAAYDAAGGITNKGTLTVRNSRIQNNIADDGGGIVNYDHAVATITDSTLSGNIASERYGASGGAIFNFGTLTIANTTITGNRAVPGRHDYSLALGGGVWNRGKLTITNSTLTDNTSDDKAGGDTLRGHGGALFNSYGGEVTIKNSTVTGNHSDHGGGIFVRGGQVTLSRTIVSGNTAVATGQEIQNTASIVADDYNLIGQSGRAGSVGFLPGARDIVPTKSVNNILLPLAHNSGKTKTHALAINSPALNASPADAGCPAKDQRGAPRPSGTKCDIGAFEGSAVMCNGVVTTHVGTAGNDVIYGTPGHDVIAGLSGNDTLQGLDGDDMICGGNGKDGLIGGRGIDTLLGEAGDDVLRGQAGDDIVNGGAGTDTCDGGANNAAGDVAAQCEQVINVP